MLKMYNYVYLPVGYICIVAPNYLVVFGFVLLSLERLFYWEYS